LLKLLAIFMLPLAILGIPIEIIGAVGLVHFFYQYWYHTQLIGNLGWLERVLVTPQQHAIHHAMNPQYIDKNFGQWFSVWDQLFGTYQRPIPGVQPVFGVTQPARTWNPIRIDFMIWIQMLRDFLSTRTLRSKLGVLISRPGERPADAAALQPVAKIDDVYCFDKFRPRISAWVVRFCVLELLLAQFLLFFFFYWITRLSHTEVLAFGGFILLHIAAYTTVMEGRRATFLLCSRLAAYLVLLLYWQGDWFGINALTAAASAMLALYFAFTIAFAYIANARGTVASENAGLRDASPLADAGALAQ
jgi:sterol desaturase/sphingolipid hydroxylase (fatty acid hydroxylase superfamily)